MNENYRALADAIILQAVKDYRTTESNGAKSAIIKFFRSDWFGVLTDLEPEILIARLKQEIKKKEDETHDS